LILWSTETKSGYSVRIDQGHVTCLSKHQESGLVVMGHESGEIVIWHQFKQWMIRNQHHLPLTGAYDPKKSDVVSLNLSDMPVRTKLHWHAHPVSCISISSDGRSLYSGGEEGVLVKWFVGADSNERRAFIPRLGGAINHISPSDVQSKAVVCLKDNSVRIVDFARFVV
jgi:WD40 repeat protein